ncbi:BadF/BadG/BcrA/BcrD ATPase family protein [Nonlabens ulvanivorans]|uniref:BadF/BadG/BcrA/BcrD ATPase family protein n=1 Tax=Nonlabens ulvanivorans TaxID=906888 RepID=UPI002942B3C0|nr:BadF/BadG/BcrA/BcrD ATPase family protein [Nonlabens ulvanivorans]WOI23446.1 N-acetylglucosamine kinase [Nonlabens ulvanivorans]
MILITDSGSTKCDWIALDNNGEQLFKVKTGGMNPAILTIEELPLRILESEELVAHKDQVEQLFFYGAGCGTEMPRLALENLLKNYFSNAQVTVKEDTAAAVYAAVGDEPGIVCILGTGSNCCFSDGDTIEQRVVSLGYTLMDEASGNWYGKNLLRDYGFRNMPSDLMKKFEEAYNLDPDYLKFHLYKQPNPNAFLAHHAEFIFQNLEERYIKKLLRKGLRKFSRNMILQFREEIKSYEVHFVGSIAHFAQARIKQVAAEFGYEVGNIVRRPIEGLVDYHRNKLKA